MERGLLQQRLCLGYSFMLVFVAEKKLKSIVEYTQQDPVYLSFEGWIIRSYDGHRLWFESPTGEGTTITRLAFMGYLIRMFAQEM